MESIYKVCCGLDIHKKVIAGCILAGKRRVQASFGTTTAELFRLLDWIQSFSCEAVAMESTGVYWKPIYNILEFSKIKTLVVNARHMKAIPGRKTDIKDAAWIADLLKHGLLKASYIPTREQRELREIIRFRRALVEERVAEMNRVQKTLEGANIKLTCVVSDLFGVTGRKILEEIIKGEKDPVKLSRNAKGSLVKKQGELADSLRGVVGPHQQVMLKYQLRHIDELSAMISEVESEIDERMSSVQREIELLDTIPGIGKRTAQLIIAEIGTDMTRFPTAAHLASWAGLCPGNNESAGKRKNGKCEKGNKNTS